MLEARFLATLQGITAGRASLTDVIETAAGLGERADLAEQLYSVWIAVNREHPQAFVAHFNCASLQTAAGNLDAAATALLAALRLKPDFHPAHINLAGVLERQGLADAAVVQWRTVVDQLALICHGISVAAGRYNGAVALALKLGALATLTAMAAGIGLLSRRRTAA